MRKLSILFGRELAHYFRSPLACTVLCFFLVLTGFNFQYGVSSLNLQPLTTTIVEAYFNTVFFWYPFVLVFPLITMRTFSEEYKLGTIEPLMTAPVRDWQVVMAKYLGALVFYLILWLPSLLYFVIFQNTTGFRAAEAVGSYFGAYSMLLLIGMFYIALGCLASALTENQIVAAIISFCLTCVMFFMSLISFLTPQISPVLRDLSSYLSPIEHMAGFSQGIFDTRPVVYYVSLTVFTLYLTLQIFQSRRWKTA
ncbi:MAG TPA: ABC transporter permease [Chthoniobacterales bacterium]